MKSAQPHCHRLKWLKLACWALGAFLLAGIGAVSISPRAALEMFLTHRLSRRVTIGELATGLSPFTVDIKNVHVANAPWGRLPVMLHVGHITAQPEMLSLLSGRPVFRTLTVEDAALLLERDASGRGNWKRPGEPSVKPDSAKEAYESRKSFPTVLSLRVINSGLTMYTSSGAKLTVDVGEMKLEASAADKPVRIDAMGAYNGTALTFDMSTDSFDALHDASRPFDVTVNAQGATVTASTSLQMTDPLNFDGFTGALHMQVQNIGRAAALAGGEFRGDLPLELTGGFARKGDIWQVSGMEGSLAANRYSQSRLQLHEGARGQPDAVTTLVNFKALQLESLSPLMQPGGERHEKAGTPVHVAGTPSTLLEAELHASQARYGKVTASDVAVHAAVQRGSDRLDMRSTEIFGSPLHVSFALKPEGKADRLSVEGRMEKIDMGALSRAMGLGGNPVRGSLDMQLRVAAVGTPAEWLRGLDGEIRCTGRGGTISRSLVQIASADLRRLLGADRSAVSVASLEARLIFERGIGNLSPFFVQTEEGTLRGKGTVDLPARTLDLTFQTDPKTTSRSSLDIPLHVTGDIASPHILPGPHILP